MGDGELHRRACRSRKAGSGRVPADTVSPAPEASSKAFARLSEARFKFSVVNLGAVADLGGARVENTRQDFTTVMPKSYTGRAGNVQYTDLLPSGNLKLDLNKLRSETIAMIAEDLGLLGVAHADEDADVGRQLARDVGLGGAAPGRDLDDHLPRAARWLAAWIPRANNSLPVPVSPTSKTVTLRLAAT